MLPLFRQWPLTVSFFLLKTGMATVVRSTRLCACEVKSCQGGKNRRQRAQSPQYEDPPSPASTVESPSNGRKQSQMKFPSLQRELAETLGQSGGLGRRTRQRSHNVTRGSLRIPELTAQLPRRLTGPFVLGERGFMEQDRPGHAQRQRGLA